MYLVEHLLIGLVLSFIIYLFLKDIVALAAIIFSVLPDLIDKPVGYLIWGSGRVIFHTLLIVVIFFVAACVAYRMQYRRIFSLLWISGLAIFIHQVVDSMWEMPRAWFWPLLGDFEVKSYDVMTVLHYKVQQELSQPNELTYAMIFLSGVILMVMYIRLWNNN